MGTNTKKKLIVKRRNTVSDDQSQTTLPSEDKSFLPEQNPKMANVSFILDRSGSMFSCIDDTIGGFNAFVESQKVDNPNGNLSLHLFGNDYTTLYTNKPVDEVEHLTTKTYRPHGGTALLDAIGTTIKEIDDNGSKRVVVILTDGQENSSQVYSKPHINDLIRLHTEWKFVFLGANQDAIGEGQTLGINPNSAMTFDAECVDSAFQGLSAAVGRQITGETQDVEFTGLERQMSCAPVQDEPDYAQEVRDLPDTMSVGLQRC